jgi:hypothetical protein
MNVIIDGVEYVPRAEIPALTDIRLQTALECLTEIQYFSECPHKHRAWAWNALKALSPELAELAAENPQAAFDRVRALR